MFCSKLHSSNNFMKRATSRSDINHRHQATKLTIVYRTTDHYRLLFHSHCTSTLPTQEEWKDTNMQTQRFTHIYTDTNSYTQIHIHSHSIFSPPLSSFHRSDPDVISEKVKTDRRYIYDFSAVLTCFDEFGRRHFILKSVMMLSKDECQGWLRAVRAFV